MFRKCRSKRREAVLFGKAFSENSIFSFIRISTRPESSGQKSA